MIPIDHETERNDVVRKNTLDGSARYRRTHRPRLGCGETLRVLSRPGLDIAALRSKGQADPEALAELIRTLVDHKLAMIRGEGATVPIEMRRSVEDFAFRSIRDLKAAQEKLDLEVAIKDPESGRSVTTALFPLLTNALVIVGINEAYEGVETIGEELVTEVDDNKKLSHYVGVLTQTKAKTQAEETEEFTQISAGEEKFLIFHLRQGFQVVISQEMFDENDHAGIEARLTALGEMSREFIEEQTLRRVTDHDASAGALASSPFVLLHPNNAGTALFQVNNNTLKRLPALGNRVINNALVDNTDLSALRVRLAGMTNSRGKRIAIPRSELVWLVPDSKYETAWAIKTSAMEPGVFNKENFYGPSGPYRTLKIVSSPKLDDLSPTAHYFGAPKRQFRRKWKLRPEIATHSGRGTEAFVRTREGLRVRIAWDMEVGAVDYVYWLQSLAAAVAPKDEVGS